MPFELVSPVINAQIAKNLLLEVSIHRYLYRHSEARIVIDWNETWLEGQKQAHNEKPTAKIGAALLNAPVALKWKSRDLQSEVVCFQGYVTAVNAQHRIRSSVVELHCVSKSRSTDQVLHYRAFQRCTLLDICERIVASDHTFQIHGGARGMLGDITIDLSVQYSETDFAYLGRMLHAWGVPMVPDDGSGHVVIGIPDLGGHGAFPAMDWDCSFVGLEGELLAIDSQNRGTSPSAVGAAQQQLNAFNQSLDWNAANYHPRLDDDHLNEREWIAEQVADTAFHANSAVYRIRWGDGVFDYAPGAGVSFGGQPWLIRETHIEGRPNADIASQEFVLQEYRVPLPLHRRRIDWPGRTLWAVVEKNYQEDPDRQGRIQVKFDIEALDKKKQNEERCWLPVMTPYAGRVGNTGTSGFLSLPEVGERVLVQFLGDWDSDAVVVGSVREYPRQGFKYDPDETKRWQTPTGNQVTLTTRQNGDDIVRIKCRDQLVFEGKIAGNTKTVLFDLFDSNGDRIHFDSGKPRLDIFCSGEIYMQAGQKLLLEGGEVQIKSLSGNVNIDGQMVMINCGPWSLDPLTLSPENIQDAPAASKRTRSKPPKWTAMVAVGAAVAAVAAVAAAADQTTFIEIELKDERGQPAANELYRLRLPDGSTREGRLDANGRAREEGVKPGTAQVSFPEIDDADWQAK